MLRTQRFCQGNKKSQIAFCSLVSLFFSSFMFSCQTVSDNSEEIKDSTKQKQIFDPLKTASHLSVLDLGYEKIVTYVKMGKIDKIDMDYAYLLAQELIERSDYVRAKELLQIVFEAHPNLIVGSLYINILQSMHLLEQAKNTANLLTVLFPNSPAPHLDLLEILTQMGNKREHERVLKNAYDKFPNESSVVIYYALNHKEHMEELLLDFSVKNPKDMPVHLALGHFYLLKEKYDKSLRFALKANEIDENNIESLEIIAISYLKLNDVEKATAYYEKAFIRNEKDPFVAFNLAKIYIQQNNFEDALDILNHMRDESGLADVSFLKGICYLNLGNFVESEKQFLNIKEGSKFYFKAIQSLIIVNFNLKKTDIAKLNFDKLEKLNQKNDSEYALFKSSYYSFLGQANEAQKVITDALIKYPLDKDLLLKKFEFIFYQGTNQDLLTVYQGLSDKLSADDEVQNFFSYAFIHKNINLDKALKMIDDVLKKSPRNGNYLDTIGLWYYVNKNYEKALGYFKEALSYEVANPVILFHVAQVYENMGQMKEAFNYLQETKKQIEKTNHYFLKINPELTLIQKEISAKICKTSQEFKGNKENQNDGYCTQNYSAKSL